MYVKVNFYKTKSAPKSTITDFKFETVLLRYYRTYTKSKILQAGNPLDICLIYHPIIALYPYYFFADK